LGARAPAGAAPGKAIQLGVKAARGELLARLDLLAALPPMTFLGCLRDRLQRCFDLFLLAGLRRVPGFGI
ncbi:MAG: hypothetical protein ACRDHL_01290, partial [Candidatus Promineifilaceae bacterium]